MLAAQPCQADCAWAPAGPGTGPGRLPLFRCAGCGSEWTRAEPWTPAERDGSVAAAVATEAARR